MRFIVTIIWAALISGIFSYVLSHMSGGQFQLANTIFLAVFIAGTAFVLGEGIIKTTEEE